MRHPHLNPFVQLPTRSKRVSETALAKGPVAVREGDAVDGETLITFHPPHVRVELSDPAFEHLKVARPRPSHAAEVLVQDVASTEEAGDTPENQPDNAADHGLALLTLRDQQPEDDAEDDQDPETNSYRGNPDAVSEDIVHNKVAFRIHCL